MVEECMNLNWIQLINWDLELFDKIDCKYWKEIPVLMWDHWVRCKGRAHRNNELKVDPWHLCNWKREVKALKSDEKGKCIVDICWAGLWMCWFNEPISKLMEWGRIMNLCKALLELIQWSVWVDVLWEKDGRYYNFLWFDWVNNVKIVKKEQEHISFVGLWLYPILKVMWICGGRMELRD